MTNSPVLIAGGGPVGMTLAIELARHGVRSIVVEQNATTTRHPKMDLTNGRSMELYRRMGIVDNLRAAGVPEDNPFDIVWVTKPGGYELHRFVYPTSRQSRALAAQANDGAQTLEPGMRISQVVLEPELKAYLDDSPLVDVRFGWTFESLEQDATGVTSVIRNSETGAADVLRTDYVAGCDGGGSAVRKQLGIELEGTFGEMPSFTVLFKTYARDVVAPHGIAWHLQWDGGVIIAQDDKEIYSLHGGGPTRGLSPTSGNAEVPDPRERVKSVLGSEFEDFEVLQASLFRVHMVVAKQYGAGRVWLAGDAAHQVVPTGGYGMNTGVGDAVALGWKLAALVNGWGGPNLLEGYEKERRPIAVQNRDGSGRHILVRMAIGQAYAKAREKGDLDAPENGHLRTALGAHIRALTNIENESWGLEHGYRYTDSPIILHEPNEPAFDPNVCIPTTWPGARLPHLYLSDGSALYDHLGSEFTLVVFHECDSTGFERAAAQLGIPLKVVRIDEFPSIYERHILLVRPDQHVAWRGDAVPEDPSLVLRHSAGLGSASRGPGAGATQAQVNA